MDNDDLMRRMEENQKIQDRINQMYPVNEPSEEELAARRERIRKMQEEMEEYERKRQEDARAQLEKMRKANQSLDDALNAYNNMGNEELERSSHTR